MYQLGDEDQLVVKSSSAKTVDDTSIHKGSATNLQPQIEGPSALFDLDRWCLSRLNEAEFVLGSAK